jgi:hypothetical protein
MNLNIEIKSGELDLAGAGTIITASPDPVRLTISDKDEPMYLYLEFKNEGSDNKTTKVVSTMEGTSTLKVVFTNYNNPLGTYTKQPWLIGYSFNRELFLCYVIYGYPESASKKIDYSFYLGKEVKNG